MKINIKHKLPKTVLNVILVMYVGLSHAALPTSINYQGELTNTDGTPVSATVNITFTLYDAATVGTSLWSDTKQVDVVDSVFNVSLGSNGNPLSIVHFQNELWLGIAVETDAEMSPRTALNLAPYAVRALDSGTIAGRTVNELDQSAHVTDETNPHNITPTQIGAVTATTLSVHSSNPAAHHSKYTDAEAVNAMGASENTNTLNHNRFTDLDAVNAIKAADGVSSNLDADLLDGFDSSSFMLSNTDNWVNVSGDTINGSLYVSVGVNANTFNLRGSTGYQIRDLPVLDISDPAGSLFVGIGKDIFFSGNSFFNTLIGFNTAGLTNEAINGFSNTLIGSASGFSLTDASENTFVGSHSGFSNSIGNANSFFGSSSGGSNTEGSNNIFLGTGSGYSNTTGNNNVFSGVLAGRNNISANGNVFTGYQAGFNNTEGFDNVFIGIDAGYDNSIGSNNVFIGALSGASNTNSNNTFVGVNSGNANTIGENNTFVGYNSALLNTSGSWNTYFGYQTGRYTTTGSANTFLGYQAGLTNSTGSNNVFIGNYAGYSETGSNKLYIDNTNTSLPLIYGDFSTNSVAINGDASITGLMRVQGSSWPTAGKSMEMAYSSTLNKGYLHVFDRDLSSWGDLTLGRSNVGIGTIDPTSRLDVVDNMLTNTVAKFRNSNTGTSSDGIEIQLGPVANPSPANRFINFKDGDGTIIAFISGDNSGGVNYSTTSDARLKTNIQDFNRGLDLVSKLRVKSYEFISSPGKESIGFIAQDMQKIIPQIVSGDSEVDASIEPMGIDYGKLTPVLVSAIQKLKLENENIKHQLSEIKLLLGI